MCPSCGYTFRIFTATMLRRLAVVLVLFAAVRKRTYAYMVLAQGAQLSNSGPSVVDLDKQQEYFIDHGPHVV